MPKRVNTRAKAKTIVTATAVARPSTLLAKPKNCCRSAKHSLLWMNPRRSTRNVVCFGMSGELTPNRLIHEKSPYLLQHAHKPVDWFPWGEEASAEARQENKPIFLSIGYST